VNETLTRCFARFLHFQLAIGALSSIAARIARHLALRVESTVTGPMLLVSSLCFSSRDFDQRLEQTRVCHCGLASSRVLVASYRQILTGYPTRDFGEFSLVRQFSEKKRPKIPIHAFSSIG
jgi:hypothetical protein